MVIANKAHNGAAWRRNNL